MMNLLMLIKVDSQIFGAFWGVGWPEVDVWQQDHLAYLFFEPSSLEPVAKHPIKSGLAEEALIANEQKISRRGSSQYPKDLLSPLHPLMSLFQ